MSAPEPFVEAENNKALRLWFIDLIDKGVPYPHNAKIWEQPVREGFAKDFTGNLNGASHNYESWVGFVGGSLDLISRKWTDYKLEHVHSVATAFDEKGHSGMVILSGNVSGHAKEGGQFYQGKLGIFAQIKWDEVTQKRVVSELREVNNPANYPGHPWASKRKPAL